MKQRMVITEDMIGKGPKRLGSVRSKNFDPCSWYGTWEHQRYGKAGCAECQRRELRQARAALLDSLLPGAKVGAYKLIWRSEGWPEVEPGTENPCLDGCNGRGFHWAHSLVVGVGMVPSVCVCTLEPA